MITAIALVLCTNLNWQFSDRCRAPVESFEVSEQGEIQGILESGVEFTQKNVVNDLGTRFQKFEMEKVYWYVTDKGIIEAKDDIEAFSKYLFKIDYE